MKSVITRNILLGIFLLLTTFLLPETALSVGVPAGTIVNNKVVATYSLVGDPTVFSTEHNSIFAVQELINLNVVWQDLAGVRVNQGKIGQALTFKLTNTGNGSDSYTLTTDSSLGGDDFNPIPNSIYLDSNGNGIFEPGTDDLYVAGANDPTLPADGILYIFVLNDIPSSGLAQDDEGFSRLTATSNTGTGVGNIISGGGENGTDAVVGLTGGIQYDDGSYRVTTLALSIVKSAEVSDLTGGLKPYTGATIRYSLSVTVTGFGSATGLVLSDPIPANTTYQPGTLTLDGNALSDAADGDSGDVGVTTINSITVTLGDMTEASPAQVVSFDVKIN